MFMRGKFREIYVVCLMLWMTQVQDSGGLLEVIYRSQHLVVTEGAELNLNCTVLYSLNSTMPKISWCKKGEKECSPIQDDYSHKTTFTKRKGQEDGTIADLVNLQFLSINQSDGGRYQCQAQETGSEPTSALGHIITISVRSEESLPAGFNESTERPTVDRTGGNGATNAPEMSAHTLGILIALQQSIAMLDF